MRTLGCAICFAALLATHASPGAAKPNIVFIMADDLGYGELGCYGQQMIKTPRIDQMAKEGLRLTDYYAGTAVCAPSRCALMTGFDVGHAFIRGNVGIPKNGKHESGQLPIPDATITVAEKLKSAGYATGLVGKWGLGYPMSEGDPLNQGFDFFAGYNCQTLAHNYYPGWIWRNHEKVELGPKNTPEGYSHYFMTREARAFIAAHKDGPFFLYLAYTIPHAQLEIPASDPNYKTYAGEDWSDKMKIHAGMISLLDQDVGGILDLLKQLGLEQNTLVIFTSDNGPHKEGGADPAFFDSAGPLRGIKRDMYEGGVRVPFIARWPGVVAPGATSARVLAHWDFMPTACELAGVQPPAGVDGISYVPLLKGDLAAQKSHKSVYFELHWPDRRGVRMGDWVALQQKTSVDDPNADKTELYNLKDDLGEKQDLAVQYPEKVEEFKRLFAEEHSPSKIFEFGEAQPGKKQKSGKNKGK